MTPIAPITLVQPPTQRQPTPLPSPEPTPGAPAHRPHAQIFCFPPVSDPGLPNQRHASPEPTGPPDGRFFFACI
ncbi:hypothetical protein TALK_10465 [Thalassospira alkalitolerans]|uniref:Uncharacterized protein n=1 Tax=Thalassospira alkalitolerans TaxID=1293890 RepID=A0A1Y2LE70_9PROT|nr:hypothetical protein TALK_10465 [Thalassospira alkalitolerans]